jgi:glyoxylase I family protein
VIPFRVQCIDHIVLRVQDLQRSVDFYNRVLQCTVVKTRPDLRLIHLRAGMSMIDLIAVDGKLGRRGGVAAAKVGRNVDHFCLQIEPFNEIEIERHLQEQGVATQGKAATNFGAGGDGLSLYLADPDGNVIELKVSANGA